MSEFVFIFFSNSCKWLEKFGKKLSAKIIFDTISKFVILFTFYVAQKMICVKVSEYEISIATSETQKYNSSSIFLSLFYV